MKQWGLTVGLCFVAYQDTNSFLGRVGGPSIGIAAFLLSLWWPTTSGSRSIAIFPTSILKRLWFFCTGLALILAAATAGDETELIFSAVKATLFVGGLLMGVALAKRINSRFRLGQLALPFTIVVLISAHCAYQVYAAEIDNDVNRQVIFYSAKKAITHFGDSNASAVYALCWLPMLSEWCSLLVRKTWATEFIKVGAVLLFSLLVYLMRSRAALAGLIAILAWQLIVKYVKSTRAVGLLLLLIATLALSYFGHRWLLESIESDGSGATKIKIYVNTFWELSHASLKKITFGEGLSKGNYTYSFGEGMYSHTLITTLLGQVGLLGMILYVVCLVRLKMQVLHWYVGLFICGLSLLYPFYETFGITLGFLMTISPEGSPASANSLH